MGGAVTVWVIVASKYGSTREIGEAIAEELRGAGYDVEVKNAAEVNTLDGVDAVVLGSAVYVGHWLKEARQLLTDKLDELGSRPVWLFSSGPIGDPPKPEEAEPEELSQAIVAIAPRGHETFAGKLDYAALTRVERLLVKALKAPEGDFRDWDAVRAWATSIVKAL